MVVAWCRRGSRIRIRPWQVAINQSLLNHGHVLCKQRLVVQRQSAVLRNSFVDERSIGRCRTPNGWML